MHESLTREQHVKGSFGSACGLVSDDAFRCFMGTELDVLTVGNCYLRKEAQNPTLKQNYETAFELA